MEVGQDDFTTPFRVLSLCRRPSNSAPRLAIGALRVQIRGYVLVSGAHTLRATPLVLASVTVMPGSSGSGAFWVFAACPEGRQQHAEAAQNPVVVSEPVCLSTGLGAAAPAAQGAVRRLSVSPRWQPWAMGQDGHSELSEAEGRS